MNPWLRLPAFGLALGLAAGFARAEPPAPRVLDGAALFSPDAVRGADEQLAALQREQGLTVLVETVAAPPEEILRAKGFSLRSRARQLAEWARQRAAPHGADVFILASREPARVWVVAAGAEADDLLSDRDRRRLARSLEGAVERRRYDAGLLDALAFLKARVAANRLAVARGAAVWLPVFWVVLAVLGGWLALLLVRLRLRAAEAGPVPGGSLLDQPDNGPVTALLGGSFGGVVGQWLYEGWRQKPRRPRPAAFEPPAPDAPAPALPAAALVPAEDATAAAGPAPVHDDPGQRPWQP